MQRYCLRHLHQLPINPTASLACSSELQHQWVIFVYYTAALITIHTFSAITLSVGCQEGIWPVKKSNKNLKTQSKGGTNTSSSSNRLHQTETVTVNVVTYLSGCRGWCMLCQTVVTQHLCRCRFLWRQLHWRRGRTVQWIPPRSAAERQIQLGSFRAVLQVIGLVFSWIPQLCSS